MRRQRRRVQRDWRRDITWRPVRRAESLSRDLSAIQESTNTATLSPITTKGVFPARLNVALRKG